MGFGRVSTLVDQTTIGAVAKYVQVQVSSVGLVGLELGPGVDVCGSCGFDPQRCIELPDSDGLLTAAVKPGAVNVRWSIPPVLPGADFPDPAGGFLQVFGMQAN